MSQKKNNSKQTKVSAERNGDKPQNAYFLSLEVENVRCFGEKQKIDFSDGSGKPKRWTIILGDNGTGKTTLLQSLIASLPTTFFLDLGGDKRNGDSLIARFPTIDARYPSWRLGRSSQMKSLSVTTTFSYEAGLEKNAFNKLREIFTLGFKVNTDRTVSLKADKFIKGAENVICFAYGASRKSSETSLSETNEENSYETLFDEGKFLKNPEEWFLQNYLAALIKQEGEKPYDPELVGKVLIKILPDVDNIRIVGKKVNGGNPKTVAQFHTPYGWVESKDLSLGYRTSMAWTVDFASRMFDLYPESENPLAEPAVVLIDEIDLHLHPKWQRELIDYLTNLFPNTQFIVTTHSPLIVQAAAARDANIVVCRREGDHVVIDQSVEAVRNWRTDQILTSDLFDLPTDRAKNIEPLLEERRKILSKAKLTKKDEKRLEELEKKIGSVPVMENPKYDEAMDIILRAAEKLGKENGVSNDSHKKTSKSSGHSKK